MRPAILDILSVKSDRDDQALRLVKAYVKKQYESDDFALIAVRRSLSWTIEKEPPFLRMTAPSAFGDYVVDFGDEWYALFNGIDEWQTLAASSLDAIKAAEDHYLAKLKSLNI